MVPLSMSGGGDRRCASASICTCMCSWIVHVQVPVHIHAPQSKAASKPARTPFRADRSGFPPRHASGTSQDAGGTPALPPRVSLCAARVSYALKNIQIVNCVPHTKQRS
jgi:hypothetical protein